LHALLGVGVDHDDLGGGVDHDDLGGGVYHDDLGAGVDHDVLGAGEVLFSDSHYLFGHCFGNQSIVPLCL